MREEELRKDLLEVHKNFQIALAKVEEKIARAAFNETISKNERMSLRKLFEETSGCLDKNKARMEEILLSEPPILKLVKQVNTN